MNPRITPKEWGLIKGALRRVFSRSELRRRVIEKTIVLGYTDPDRPRVKKWSKCPMCQQMTPTYLMEVDHMIPIVGLDMTLLDMDANTLVNRIWCDEFNLQGVDKQCHKAKTKLENAERRKNKNERKASQITQGSNQECGQRAIPGGNDSRDGRNRKKRTVKAN